MSMSKASRASSITSSSTNTTSAESLKTKPGVRTGTPVKIRGGAFCGQIGFIEARKPNRLALVWIEVLGRPVRVEVEPYYLDVLN